MQGVTSFWAKQLHLSRTWFRLAGKRDDTNTFPRALDEMEFEDVLEDASQPTETAAACLKPPAGPSGLLLFRLSIPARVPSPPLLGR